DAGAAHEVVTLPRPDERAARAEHVDVPERVVTSAGGGTAVEGRARALDPTGAARAYRREARGTALLPRLGVVKPHALTLAVLGRDAPSELEVQRAASNLRYHEAGVVRVCPENQRTAR